MSESILSVQHLTVRFDLSRSHLARLLTGEKRRVVHAVEDVSFNVERGSTFALVGESGCGKTTVARCVAGIHRPTAGRIIFMGVDLSTLRSRRTARPYRRQMQMIFQDPQASLNPRWRVGRTIAEPIVTHRIVKERSRIHERVRELLRLVGLAPADAAKFPHQFSGGQRQRISIARALASEPWFVVCDEPTSALDVSIQAQILNLMTDLQRRLGLTYLLISHNLAVVGHMADRVGVMYLGRMVECGTADVVLNRPLHPYTRMLLETAPDIENEDRPRTPLGGEVPSPIDPPPGCAFHPRCPLSTARCKAELPQPIAVGDAWAACHAIEEGRLTFASAGAIGSSSVVRDPLAKVLS
jgi:peptide/nickel transport system ATP-binding protein